MELPSGSFNARVYDYTDTAGKRHYRSITGASKREVEKEVKRFQGERNGHRGNDTSDLTVGGAIDLYINERRAVLSPSTLAGYGSIRRVAFASLMPIRIDRLTASDVQTAVSALAADHAPKTVFNRTSLLMSAIKYVDPTANFNLKLPQAKKTKVEIPTKDEVLKLLAYFENTEMELPFMLAALCGMRASEIFGLHWRNVDRKAGMITIAEALVQGESGKVLKGTKTVSGTRTISPPARVLSVLEKEGESAESDGFVIGMTYNAFARRLTTAESKLGIPHYSPHKLRHYCVSVMLALDIPKFYIEKYVGHESEAMIERVYGHIMKDAKAENEKRLNDYYAKIL